MSSFQAGTVDKTPYVDPTPLPDHIPKVAELGVSSAPLKSAAFFIGAYCKEYNGTFVLYCACRNRTQVLCVEDFMLCKAEDRNPEHCLKEGRRVTRCATDLWV
jgi:NADH dehydrogenase (ubiquinone) 1 alpha subcomplex subunit 8